MDKWNANQTARDLMAGKYDGGISSFLESLSKEQLAELVQAVAEFKRDQTPGTA
jgi:hypothetical protein